MENRIDARFEKVSFEQFKKDVAKLKNKFTDEEIQATYDNIELPVRGTKGSAGYDFKCPFNIDLIRHEEIIIPTGIRFFCGENFYLPVFPRSSYGFKYHMVIANTVGIIDSDYYNSDNEGHILIKLVYEGYDNDEEGKLLSIKAGDKFVQGIISLYFIINDDNVTDERNGGIGSTDVPKKLSKKEILDDIYKRTDTITKQYVYSFSSDAVLQRLHEELYRMNDTIESTYGIRVNFLVMNDIMTNSVHVKIDSIEEYGNLFTVKEWLDIK